MENIVVPFALFRLTVKLYVLLLLDQHLVFDDYLSLLQLAYNILWNMDSLVNIQLCNHHLDLLQFFECFEMFLNHFLLFDRKNFFHQSQNYNPLFPQLEDNIACKFLDHLIFK